jgi:hypothetical protein
MDEPSDFSSAKNTHVTRRSASRTWLGRLFIVFVFLAIANFIVFAIVAGRIGGDAIDGGIVAGHYFVEEHGKYTEVSESIWKYSYAHLAITAGMYLLGGCWGLAMAIHDRRTRENSAGYPGNLPRM